MVTSRLDDPIVPLQCLEVHVERLAAAFARTRAAFQSSAPSALSGILRVQDKEGAMILVKRQRRAAKL